MVPQSGAKENFYFNVYYITLNSNCEAQREPKKLKKNVEGRVRNQNYCMSNLSVIKMRGQRKRFKWRAKDSLIIVENVLLERISAIDNNQNKTNISAAIC